MSVYPGIKQGLLADIEDERRRQDAQWGGPEHDDEHSMYDWRNYIIKQMIAFENDIHGPTRRSRLIKIAALAVAALECIDRADELAVRG